MSATQSQTEDATHMNDDDLIDAVDEHMTVQQVRSWMSENGLARSRGAKKRESIRQAIDQERWTVAVLVEGLGGRFEVTCTCGMDMSFHDGETAEATARDHKSRNPRHFPRATETETGERLYG